MTMEPRIDGGRLWRSLMELAEVGALPGGGVRRVALTDEDRRGRELFAGWCREAGLRVRVDGVGNVFARREGADPARAPVLCGSHLDTQPNGGRFDGAYGVMAGLEVMRTLNDAGLVTQAPLELVAWSNEEGTRFSPSMMGSMAWAGLLDVAEVLATRDADGKDFGAELARMGYQGNAPASRECAAYFEAHIEQGPVLEETGCTIGVVTGGQGQCWYDVVMRGRDAHAGTTPMDRRHDALAGAARVVLGVQELGAACGGCATVGRLEVRPNSRNVVPGEVAFSIEVRHPSDEQRLKMDRAVRGMVDEACAREGLESELTRVLDQPAVPFDAQCVARVREAAVREGLRHRDIVSGAAHDAIAVARIAPTAMVFVPCEGGISHNEAENASPADLAAGCQVLLDAMLCSAR